MIILFEPAVNGTIVDAGQSAILLCILDPEERFPRERRDGKSMVAGAPETFDGFSIADDQ